MNEKQVIKALKSEGWIIDRTGRHCIMKKVNKLCQFLHMEVKIYLLVP
jgi:predicted RNA binding protein YcfA (HicA-like mRNA interferase family)